MDDNDEENLIVSKETEEDDYQEIDPNDLYIIEDQSNFKPTNEMILAYAKLLGYKPEEDPEEILKISEKYLTCELPEPLIRAFTKSEYRILYIDRETQDITLENEIDDKARNEIDEFRNKYNTNKKSSLKTTQEELKKKLNEQKEYNDKLKFDDNIQIIDNEEENEEEENNNAKKLNNSLNENINENKNKDLNKKDNINMNKKNKDSNINNDKSSEEKYDDFDDFFMESSKSSNEDKEQEKTIKSQNFEEEDKKEEEKKKNENSNIENNKKKEFIANHQNSPKKNEDEIIISNKKYQKSQKKINKNSSEENIKNEESKEKRNYLEIIKMNLNSYKIKIKQDYIKKKKDFASKYNNIIMTNLKKKKSLQISQNTLEDLDTYESTLKQKMEQELNKYKNNLISEYEYNELNQSSEEIDDIKKNYEVKKLKLESDIRIQKERNKNSKENLLKKNKKSLENKTIQLEEILQNKKSKLILKNKKDINELEKKYQKYYDDYISQYEKSFLKDQNDNNLSNSLFNNNLKELEEEYITELKEKFEQQKITINYELETKMIEDLEIYKAQEKANKEQELNKINEKMNNLGSNYFNEIDFIKKQSETQKKNDDEIIYEKIQKIANIFFNELKNKINDKVNEEIKQINILIKQSNNFNNREELQIEENLIDKFVAFNSKLGEKRSLYDLIEKEYIEIKMKIEYMSKVISIISKLLIEKGTEISFNLNPENKKDNKDSLLVNEIISNIQNLLDEFKLKNENNTNKIIYPFINEEIENLLDNIRNTKLKNKFRNNNYQNYSFMNTKGINIKNSIDLNPQLNPTYNSYRFPMQEKKVIKSFSQNKNNINNNIYNRNNISINKIDEQNSEKENGSGTSISINNNNGIINLELSNEFLTEFPQELKNLYVQIISFLKEESALIEKEKQDLNNQDIINSNMQILQKNDNLKQYKNDFDLILSQEKINSRNHKANLENKIKLFKKIESFWTETIYYIYNNYTSSDKIKIKLNNIIGNINDYKKRFNNGSKIDFNVGMTNSKNFMEQNYNNMFYNKYKYNNRYSSSDKKYN